MFAARITLPHFSVSSARSLPYSACERASGVAKVGDPRLDPRIGEARVDLPVELVDDLDRRVARRANALSPGRLVARHEFSDGR